jgi:hypothetical protein
MAMTRPIVLSTITRLRRVIVQILVRQFPLMHLFLNRLNIYLDDSEHRFHRACVFRIERPIRHRQQQMVYFHFRRVFISAVVVQ